ncbi:MAG: NAD-dependent succinate-semialdehyde dehydrogenase [Acidimicrobiales bacterium]|jgi:succinate-semialdehyde dehydrogenase/glutarate-semialdehyde dehydrogenase
MTPPSSPATSLDAASTLVAARLDGLREAGLVREDLYVDGRWRQASNDQRLEVHDPATGILVGAVATASAEDTREAIAAASRALAGWRALPAGVRAEVLWRWQQLLTSSSEELAALLTIEQGKPIGEAVGELTYSAAFLRYFAEEARRAYGEVIPYNRPGRRLFALRQPVGVVAAITPWNFPALMIARKVAPAIAAGCTVVLKPPSEAPLSALALAELASRAGMPPGVLNVVHGDPVVVGAVLTESPDVRMLTFTGSTEVGKLLMAQCAPTVKRVALELGGNAPFVVFDDADLEAAVTGAIESKFRNAGQTCVCSNRVLVHAKVHDEFVERLTQGVGELVVGHGIDPRVQVGPLIDGRALAKVQRHLLDATSSGAEVRRGGRPHELGGTFFEPTVVVGAQAGMAIAREETFGPVAPVFRFETEEEALALANATESGLAAYFYTRDLGRALRFGEALEFGVVGVNTGSISYEGAPFGGMKQSGLGREGSHHGLEEFLEVKYLCVDGVTATAR